MTEKERVAARLNLLATEAHDRVRNPRPWDWCVANRYHDTLVRAAALLRSEPVGESVAHGSAWQVVGRGSALKACPRCGSLALEGESECTFCGEEPSDDGSWRIAGNLPTHPSAPPAAPEAQEPERDERWDELKERHNREACAWQRRHGITTREQQRIWQETGKLPMGEHHV